jgi:hypothetical protein
VDSKKWLILQADREFGPYGPETSHFLRECFSLKYAIEANGDVADIWGLRHSNFNEKPNFNGYDYIFVEEQYEFDWIPWEEIGKTKAITMQLAGEIHVHQQFYQWTDLFDIVLHPFKKILFDTMPKYPNKKHIWYPSAMDGRYYTLKNLPKVYDVIWMGTHTREYIQDLVRDVGLVNIMKGGWGYINTLASAKVALNRRQNIDINYKAFEITGVGTCLVSDYDEQYEEMGFKDGVNCYFYKNYSECVDKIRFALDNNYEDVGIKGYELSRKHTYEERIKRLKRILNNEIGGINFD